MKKYRKYGIVATALSISLVVAGTGSNVAMATKGTTTTKNTTKVTAPTVVHTLANLQPIKITGKSTARLTDVNIFDQ